MREIKTEIQIDTTPEKIWGVLMKLSEWPDWNPIVNKVDGKAELGATISFVMCDSKGKNSQKYNATITILEEKKRFCYVAKMGATFLFSVERILELEAIGEKTKFVQRENYQGLLVGLFWKKLDAYARAMLNSMNEALKNKTEASG